MKLSLSVRIQVAWLNYVKKSLAYFRLLEVYCTPQKLVNVPMLLRTEKSGEMAWQTLGRMEARERHALRWYENLKP